MKILLVIFLGLISYNLELMAQCGNVNPNPIPPNNSLGSPDSLNTDIYNIRLHIHFINKNDGTGNYSATNDPIPTDGFFGGNGFEFANRLIPALNQNLAQNMPQNLNPSAPVNPILHRFVLAGVYFWNNTDRYYADHTISSDIDFFTSNYAKNTTEVLNVFLTHNISNNNNSVTGRANAFGGISCMQCGWIKTYLEWRDKPAGNLPWEDYQDIFEDIVNHEIGHCLSLFHTVAGGSNDNCADTPPPTFNPINYCWCSNTCSNNLMDYNCADNALSPCQINYIENHILTSKLEMLTCYYGSKLNLNLCGLTTNDLYVSKNINLNVGCSGSAVVNNYRRVVFNAENILIGKDFEVALGNEFETLMVASCE